MKCPGLDGRDADTVSSTQNGLDAHFRHDPHPLRVRRHDVVETRPKAMGHKSIPITIPGRRVVQITWWIHPIEVIVGIVSMEHLFHGKPSLITSCGGTYQEVPSMLLLRMLRIQGNEKPNSKGCSIRPSTFDNLLKIFDRQ